MKRHLISVAAASAALLVVASCGSSGSSGSGSSGTSPSSSSPVSAATSAGSGSASTSSGGTSASASAAGTSTARAGGTSASGSSGGAAKPGGTIVMRLKTDAGTLDPALSTVGGQMIDTFLYDPLVNINLKGKVVSGIAKSWKVTPNSATFTLRDDVTCSDGHKITPSDVKANYDYLKNPDTHATWIVSNMSTTDYTVTADDAAGTVTITLPQAYGNLIQGVAAIGIVCPAGLKDPKKLTTHSYGTGPFVVDSATPDVAYKLKARKGYTWGPDGETTGVNGFPSELVWKVVKDDSTAVNMFLRGELTLLPMSGTEVKRLQGSSRVTGSQKVASTGTYMVFNQLKGRILDGDKPLREALAMATDRQSVAQVFAGDLGKVTNTLVNQQPKTCDDSSAAGSVPKFDIAAAKQMLDADGWKVGSGGIREKNGKKLTITLLANDATKAYWEYLQQVWSTQLGVDAKLVTLDNNSATSRLLKGGNWDVSAIRIATNLQSTWTQFLMGKQPPNGLNLGSGNKTYEQLATKALQTPGQPGCDLWIKAEESAFTSMDLFPLFVPQTVWFANNVKFTAIWDGGVLPLSLRTTG